MIGVVDYSASNLRSVKKALEYLGMECKIIQSEDDFPNVKKIILPGVGAFGTAIEKLHSARIYGIIRDWLLADKPFLGICLGMQILFEKSEESKDVKGFGVLKGKAIRFKKHKVPQIGWNQVKIVRRAKIMSGIKNHSFFYFLHAYYVVPQDNNITVGTTEYGVCYPAVIEKIIYMGYSSIPKKVVSWDLNY